MEVDSNKRRIKKVKRLRILSWTLFGIGIFFLLLLVLLGGFLAVLQDLEGNSYIVPTNGSLVTVLFLVGWYLLRRYYKKVEKEAAKELRVEN